MSRRRLLIVCSIVLVVLVHSLPVLAWQPYLRPGLNELISVSSAGAQSDDNSYFAGMSSDARYVVFFSHSAELVPDDVNDQPDVFLRDRVEGTTELVSVSTSGEQTNGSSFQPSISPDGRFVVFLSYATNLVGDEEDPRFARVYVRDLEAGTTERVLNAVTGGSSSGGALKPSISEGGRFVTFHSSANDLVEGDTNDRIDVFVYDRENDEMKRVSHGFDGSESNGTSAHPKISGDGRYILFSSTATNVIPNDENGVNDVFLYDRDSETTELVSVGLGGHGNGDSTTLGASITPDGRFVAFQSQASNLVPNDTNGVTNYMDGYDVFLRDRESGRTERVNVTAGGFEMRKANSPSISDDGRYVAFYSIAEGEDPGSFTYGSDIWVHDRVTRDTELVSATPFNQPARGQNDNPVISGDGTFVVFQSDSGEFVPGDANGRSDIVGRYRGAELEVLRVAPVKRKDAEFEGLATVSGAVLSAGSDPEGDSLGPAVTDITEASFIFRPERGDLMVHIGLADLPQIVPTVAGSAAIVRGQPGLGAAPGITHGLAFVFEGQPYEVRFSSVAADPSANNLRRAGLYRCAEVCTRVVTLDAGYGTGGTDLRVSIPTGLLGLEPGEGFAQIRAFSAPGEALTGPLGTAYDELALADRVTPEPRVVIGVGSPEAAGTVANASLHNGSFVGTFEEAPSSGQDVWARVCLDDRCGAAASHRVD